MIYGSGAIAQKDVKLNPFALGRMESDATRTKPDGLIVEEEKSPA